MKTQEFIRLRRAAVENGWNVELEVVPDSKETVALFTKSLKPQDGTREIRVFFEIEEDNTIVLGCYLGKTEIRMTQVRNLLENL